MVSRYYLLQIVLFVVLLSLTLAGFVLVLSLDLHPALFVFGGLALVAEILVFIRRLNVLNRQVGSVMQSLQNHDTGIRLQERYANRLSVELQQAFGHLLESFSRLKMDYARKEQLYMAMIEHSATGFISIDEHGDFEIMNQAARNLLGTRFTSNLERLKKEMPGLYQLLTELEDGEAGICTIHHPEGASLVRMSTARINFREHTFTLVSLQDIRREVDQRELESWQKLIRILNHEIMNSIAPITSASRSLRTLFLDGEQPLEPSLIDEKKITDTLDGLDIIGSMSAGLQHFVENYRKLSRIPDPVPVPLDLARWTGTLKVLAGEIVEQGGGRLEIFLGEGTPEPKADEGLLNQVMLNLVHNAMEAPGREPAGSVQATNSERWVEIRIGPSEGGKTSIRVKNNGAPVLPEELDKIFIPFYTTKEKGAGIGLFLSRQIIFMHHGTLDAYTAPDGDPVFEILL